MGRLAVVGTFYQRHENTEALLRRVIEESVRPPDEFWVMCEGKDDFDVAWQAAVAGGWLTSKATALYIDLVPTPRFDNRYEIIPYSNKINRALDQTEADYIVYLDNGSMPHPDKYVLMAAALDEHPEWGAVYCGQRRTGHGNAVSQAGAVVEDAYCRLNYTQVMHRLTDDRWTLDMRHANPDLADALFWRELHKSLGPFYPVAEGIILDEHHIEGDAAVGI